MARKISKISVKKQEYTINNTQLADKMESIAKKLNTLSTTELFKSESHKNSYPKKIPLEIEKISSKLLHLNDIVVSRFIQKLFSKNLKKMGLKELCEIKKLIDREIALKSNKKVNESMEDGLSLPF